jgi:hypothetical protein
MIFMWKPFKLTTEREYLLLASGVLLIAVSYQDVFQLVVAAAYKRPLLVGGEAWFSLLGIVGIGLMYGVLARHYIGKKGIFAFLIPPSQRPFSMDFLEYKNEPQFDVRDMTDYNQWCMAETYRIRVLLKEEVPKSEEADELSKKANATSLQEATVAKEPMGSLNKIVSHATLSATEVNELQERLARSKRKRNHTF